MPPTTDSKYSVLSSILSNILDSNNTVQDKKVMIFCTFHATIHYLEKKLNSSFPLARVTTLSGLDDISDTLMTGHTQRDSKRLEFMKNDKPSILICSEVAGEGLDFQFCHYLVNYDMPWNPSKLEQRVGRLDRRRDSGDPA